MRGPGNFSTVEDSQKNPFIGENKPIGDRTSTEGARTVLERTHPNPETGRRLGKKSRKKRTTQKPQKNEGGMHKN